MNRPGHRSTHGATVATGRWASTTAHDSGFSLVEALVALAVTSLIGGGLMSILWSAQKVNEDTVVQLGAQQGGRMAVDKLHRDLMNAGIGLQDLIAPFASIERRLDDGVEIRWNPNGLAVTATDDFTTGQTQIDVVTTAGLTPGQFVLVTDSVGNLEKLSIDTLTATRITTNEAATANFLLINGAAVMSIVQVQYWVDSTTGTSTLWRQVDTHTATPVALPVQAFDLVYYDNSTPQVVFVPTTVPESLRIRGVEIDLILDAEGERIEGGPLDSFSLNSRVVPRAVLLTQ